VVVNVVEKIQPPCRDHLSIVFKGRAKKKMLSSKPNRVRGTAIQMNKGTPKYA